MSPDPTINLINNGAVVAQPNPRVEKASLSGVEKLFLDFYGLAEQPFGVTPDPRFLFLGSKHREASAALEYGTETHRGFLALIAKPGMGKTTLLFRYLDSLRDTARTCLIFQTDGNSRDLLTHLLADIGLDGKRKSVVEMRSMLNEILLNEMRAGRRFILVIDEAQNLSVETLESVRLLSNFETPQAKLMQIILSGQPQLAERLASPALAQLRQRISFFIKIEPFTREETGSYISHRLSVAGYARPQLFTDGAQALIAEQSDGVPRMINNICFGAMSLAWALKRKTIDQAMIVDVMSEINPSEHIEKASTVSRSIPQAASTHPAPQFLRPISQDLPARAGLPKFAAGAALILLIIWLASGFRIRNARVFEISTHSVTAASAPPGTSATAAPPVSMNDRNSAPSAVEHLTSPKGANDEPASTIQQYGAQVEAGIRRFFRSFSHFTEAHANPS